MIGHIARLVWNRKRANALTIVEVAFSFIVLFAVVLLGVMYLDNARKPLGFDIDRALNVEIDVRQQTDDEWTPEQIERTRTLLTTVRSLPEVEMAACALSVPYQFSSSIGVQRFGGREIEFERDEVTDDFAELFGLEITRGRWFSRDDNAALIPPIVVNERFATAVFGDDDPIGKVLNESDPRSATRIVGVVRDFRKGGELASDSHFMFERANLENPALRPPRNIVVRVRPGTNAQFEEKLAKTMQDTVRDWGFAVTSVESLREQAFRFRMTPLVVLGIVSGFLLIMVGLGMTGVLWQNVTRRTKEIGLRRVAGATPRDVFVQIVGELLVVTSIAIAIALVVVVQAPIFDLIGSVPVAVYSLAVVVSVLLVYGLALAAGLYPSWLATRVQPIDALRYE